MTSTDFEKLNSKNPKVKYGFAKELLKTGAENPEQLYEDFDYWVKLMSGDNNVLKWTAIDIIGYLSAVDKGNRIGGILPDLIKILHGGALISCNHSIFSLGLIALNKPEFKQMIFNEFMAISSDRFDTDECKNIAVGKVIEALKPFVPDIKNDKNIIGFIENAAKSERASTRKKAEHLLTAVQTSGSVTKNAPQNV
ncbi:MAG: hypothetical protein LKK19_06505 [Bacteroidales bacterium]|jgi:hypothetical protein|nr:hypothetical protein [Bacteroidales bacterium]MCI2122337.1 hypothetical protein [Bacteroidales bacterium]MCI2145736.1 hypothetical protein [Bacteroidales bacterium]